MKQEHEDFFLIILGWIIAPFLYLWIIFRGIVDLFYNIGYHGPIKTFKLIYHRWFRK